MIFGAWERQCEGMGQPPVSSRTEWNWKIGLERMRAAGAVISSTEMMIYELMRSSSSAAFKEILPY